MKAKEERGEYPVSRAGLIGWVFASWAGRGMVLLLCIVCLLSFLLVREDSILRTLEDEEALAVRMSILADDASQSVSILATFLTCGTPGEDEDVAAHAGRAQAALEGMGDQDVFRVARETAALSKLVQRAEQLRAESGAGFRADPGDTWAEVSSGLRYQMRVLEQTLQERLNDWRAMKAWKHERARAKRTQLAAAVVMLGFLAFLWPAWMSWHGWEKLARQIGEMERGEFGGSVGVEKWDDHREIMRSVNRISEDLASRQKAYAESAAREQKTARQLRLILDEMRRGIFDRRFDPGKRSVWVPTAAALDDLADFLKGEMDARAAEEARRRRTVEVPRDQLYLLEKLLRARGEEVASILERVPGNSPVRDFAADLAMISGSRLETLEKIDARLRGFQGSWKAVTGSIEMREDSLEKEYEFIHETSSTVDEVSVAAKQSSQMVEHVFRASQKAMNTAGEGKDLVRQSIDGMNLISDQVNAIAHHILGLSKKAQEVGNIVRVVGEVSKQTNLLALNAAIEAAGAGEHGKGFAVVAKEIRELAVKSSQSTQAIEKLITEMQDATNTAVLSTEEGARSVQSGVRTINSLNASFGQILQRFQEVVESAQQISTASQEQTTGARQVAGSIASIDRMMLASLRDLKALREQLGDFQQVAADLEELSGTPAKEQQNT